MTEDEIEELVIRLDERSENIASRLTSIEQQMVSVVAGINIGRGRKLAFALIGAVATAVIGLSMQAASYLLDYFHKP